jgi:hypothetical protein
VEVDGQRITSNRINDKVKGDMKTEEGITMEGDLLTNNGDKGNQKILREEMHTEVINLI